MTDNELKQLFNDVLNFFGFEEHVLTNQSNRKLFLEDRFSKWTVSCFGDFGKLPHERVFIFEDEHDFLFQLGEIEEFSSHLHFKNPFFKCSSFEEARVKLDMMSELHHL